MRILWFELAMLLAAVAALFVLVPRFKPESKFIAGLVVLIAALLTVTNIYLKANTGHGLDDRAICAMYPSGQWCKDALQSQPAAAPEPEPISAPTTNPAAPPNVRFFFPNIQAVRDAINALTPETTSERLAELFGPPASRKTYPEQRYKDEAAEIIEYRAGPYRLFVVRTPSHFIGYGIAASSEPDAGGNTPLMFLSRGSAGADWNGENGLESIRLPGIAYACDDDVNGQPPKFAVISARYQWPTATPRCNFGRPGMYADYSFVFTTAAVDMDSEICRNEWAKIEEPGMISRLQCPSYATMKPIFVFMTKVDVDVQVYTVWIWDAVFVLQ